MPSPEPHPRITPIQAACLVAAPLIELIARTQLVPYFDDPGEYLAEVAADPGRAELGASLVVLSALLLIPGLLGITSLLRERMPRLAIVGGGIAVAGCVGMVTLSTTALVAAQMVDRPGEERVMTALWDRVWTDPGIWVHWLPLLGALGFLVLAVGLVRAGHVTWPAATLFGLSGAALLVTSAGPVRGVLLAAAGAALLGFGWVAAALRGPAQSSAAVAVRSSQRA